MATWGEFALAEPDMARGVREMLYQYGTGLGFLATVREDGGPRLHPICPIVEEDGLFAFIVPSPKCRDLERDGRYALHAYPAEELDDEAYLCGRARFADDAVTRARAANATDRSPDDTEMLFELTIDRAMLARYTHRGTWPPTYTTWSG